MSSEHELVTAKQAEEIFEKHGLSKATFRRRVDSGSIDKIMEDGKLRGALYPRSQVLSATRKKAVSITPAIAYQAVPDDMEDIAPVLNQLFGGYPDIPRWQSWMQANPQVGFLVRTQEKVVGCGFLLPLAEEHILSILEREVTLPTKGSDVLPYKVGERYCVYARSIGVLQEGIPKDERKYWAGILLKKMLSSVIALGNEGIILDKIYGRSDTPAGERTMRAIGMTQLRTTTSHQNFVIDVENSGLPMVVKYRGKLTVWLQRNSGE